MSSAPTRFCAGGAGRAYTRRPLPGPENHRFAGLLDIAISMERSLLAGHGREAAPLPHALIAASSVSDLERLDGCTMGANVQDWAAFGRVAASSLRWGLWAY